MRSRRPGRPHGCEVDDSMVRIRSWREYSSAQVGHVPVDGPVGERLEDSLADRARLRDPGMQVRPTCRAAIRGDERIILGISVAGPATGWWPGPGKPAQLLVFFSEASRVR